MHAVSCWLPNLLTMRLVAGQGDAGQQQHQEMPTSLAARLQQRHAAATASKQQLPAPQPTQISDFTCSSADILTEQQRRQWGFGDLGRVDLGKSGASALRDSHVLYKARQLTQDELVMALKRVFEEYNLWDGGTSRSEMDKIRFQRCVRDSKLIQVGSINHHVMGLNEWLKIASHSQHQALLTTHDTDCINPPGACNNAGMLSYHA